MDVVFLLDVDNTLVDNDGARAQLWTATDGLLGVERSKEFWSEYEEVRRRRGVVDFLATLAAFHRRFPDTPAALDRVILDFPYERFRYPDALDVVATLWERGRVAILSDGDPTFQPIKIARAGLAQAVRGNVMVFDHKDAHLADVARLFPADHYVAVDDKADVLARLKTRWGGRLSTVHVLQGKYSDDAFDGPRPDAVIAHIGDLRQLVGTSDGLRVFIEGASMTTGG